LILNAKINKDMKHQSQQDSINGEVQHGETVIIQKSTSIKTFTPEEELKYLVERGDWELVLTSTAFAKRSPEAGAQLIREAMDKRIDQLGKTLNYLVNRGAEYHSAAMGVLQRLREIRRIRDDILKKIYEQYPCTISDKIGEKMEFY
jgi:hypothetical protein